jgi:hypothetical protein
MPVNNLAWGLWEDQNKKSDPDRHQKVTNPQLCDIGMAHSIRRLYWRYWSSNLKSLKVAKHHSVVTAEQGESPGWKLGRVVGHWAWDKQCVSLNHHRLTVYISRCSATTPVSYPASLRNFPNGCQGHPRFHPPPDRPPIPNRIQIVFGRAAVFYSTIGMGWQKMHKAVETW